jgi:TBC1 domain family member 15
MFAVPSDLPTPDSNSREYTFSPSTDEIGAQAPANEHTEKLCEILLTYGFYEKDLGKSAIDMKGSWTTIRSVSLRREDAQLADSQVSSPVYPSPKPSRRTRSGLVCLGDEGYVQGMSDLCSPLYVVMKGDEVMTFWCFVALMERMVCKVLFTQSIRK